MVEGLVDELRLLTSHRFKAAAWPCSETFGSGNN
jgi:hypothetical protein